VVFVTRFIFVISGTARSYYTDLSGMTVTWSFHFNNNLSLIRNVFVTDYRAFLTKQPSSISIETLSEVDALVFTSEAVEYLMEKILEVRDMDAKTKRKGLHIHVRQAFSLLTMSATERYHKLLMKSPT
jgi:hypothetical protein